MTQKPTFLLKAEGLCGLVWLGVCMGVWLGVWMGMWNGVVGCVVSPHSHIVT